MTLTVTQNLTEITLDISAETGVSSVNGETGIVVLTTDDIAEGVTNLYYPGDQDISGIATNAAAITTLQGEQTTQDAAIALNTAKVSFDSASSTRLANTSGTNTGDQDLSGLALKSNVLERDNTDVYTPTLDYHPVTKKYVDDNVGSITPPLTSSSTTIDLSNVLGNYAFASVASTSATFTLTGVVTGGKALVLIDTTAKTEFPTVTGSTQINSAPFEAGVEFYLAIENNGTATEHYFVKKTVGALVDYLEATDIDTLAELNAIVTDATLIDTNDARLSDARTPTAHTHTASEITDFDTEVSNNASVVANTAKVSYTDAAKVAGIENNATADQTASEVPIVDTGDLITATDVEGALAENRTAIDLNTAKVTFDSTSSTKVGFISVTQAVDLDTMESNIATNNSKVGVTTQISNVVEDTTPQLGGELDLNGHSVGGDAQTATGDGTTTIDWSLGNFFHFQFGAFNEVFTFTAPNKAGTFILKLVQDSVGSRTATFPATVKWSVGVAPDLTTTATTGTDIITFYFDGTNYFAVEVLDFS